MMSSEEKPLWLLQVENLQMHQQLIPKTANKILSCYDRNTKLLDNETVKFAADEIKSTPLYIIPIFIIMRPRQLSLF